VALVADGEAFMMSRHESGLLPKSLWNFPDVLGKPGEDLSARFADRHGLELIFDRLIGTVRHQITTHRLHLHVMTARLEKPAPEAFRWIDPRDGSFARSSYVGKVLRLLEETQKGPQGRQRHQRQREKSSP
jgi:adenine-specific DNA glycosylase